MYGVAEVPQGLLWMTSKAIAVMQRFKLCSILFLSSLIACISAVGCSRVGEPDTRSAQLRVGVSAEPDALNPLFTHTAIADDVSALLFAPLFRYDDRGVMIPELATRVPTVANGDVQANGLRVTLHLRPHVYWSDGAPLDARDVVFTWRAVLNPANNTKLRSGWENIRSIHAVNRQTVVLDLRHVDATIVTLFAAGGSDAAYPPLPAHLLAGLANLNQARFNAFPISSGPWLLTSWQHGSSLTFVPNRRYWRPVAPLTGLRFVVLPQASSLLTALHAHEIDYVDQLPEDSLHLVRSFPDIVTADHLVASYRHLDMNVRDPVLRDVRVRLALIEGVNWSRILERVYHGAGQRAVSDIFPQSFAAPHLPLYPYDVQAAARLLDASGWKRSRTGMRQRRGQPLALSIMSSNVNTTSAEAEVQIAADLHALGVQVEQKNLPVSYLFAQNGPLYTGKYQLAWAADTRGPDPDNTADWVTSAQPPNGGNTVFLHDVQVDALAAAARATNDPTRRRALYQREEERLHALAPVFVLSWQRATVAMTTRLVGVRPVPYGSNFWNSWQWRWR